jgi:RNA polymerase sigma factor (sigma-70 family)
MSKSALRHPARLAGASLLRLQSDERLAELAAAGHGAAFDAIVTRHRPALLRYCGAIVGASRAEDAVQQTLINAHAALGDADEVRHLRSWLYRIAHNVSLNVLRGMRDEVPLDADGVAGALPVSESPAESFESSERFRATVAALQALPERQRAALVLRELEGRSHEEIAEVLGVSAGSARQHLMRARVTMRGAVTAVTPWGLIARIAELASAGSGVPGGGGLETAAGAGLGTGLVKLTAGVMATGALVGGAAVGTHEVVRDDAAVPARADTLRHAGRAAAAKPRLSVRTTRVVATPTTTVASAVVRAERREHEREAERRRERHRGRGRDDSAGSTSGPGSSPSPAASSDDDAPRGSSEPSEGSGSGSNGSGRGHTEDSTTSHSGSSGSSGDSGTSGGDGSSSGSSGSGTSSSGSSGSGSSGSGKSASGSGKGSSSAGSGSSDSGTSTTATTAIPLVPETSGSGSSDPGSPASGSGSSGSSGGSGSGKPSDDSASSGSGGDG